MQILIIDDILPSPTIGAGFPRAFKMLKSLIGNEIYFYQTKKIKATINKDFLIKNKISICEKFPEHADVVIIARPHNMFNFKDVVRKLYPNSKLIYDMESLWYKKFELQKEITGTVPSWATIYDELSMAKEADRVITVNENEKNIINLKNTYVLSYWVAPRYFVNNKKFNFLMLGGLLAEHSPNEDATYWFIKNCWDKIKKDKLLVAGIGHTQRLKDCKEVEYVGFIHDLPSFLNSGKAFIAPTRFSSGIPLKVCEAMASGVPCIISKILAEQLNVGDAALVANSAEEFIEACNQLYDDANLCKKLKQNGYEFVIKNFNEEKFNNELIEILKF